MQPKWTRRLGLAGLIGGLIYASVGCAQERPAINQVQVNALSKHFFVGANLSDPSDDPEFYMRNTVIDVPYGSGQDGLFTASYAQPLSRIRWEIQENTLIARLTYDRIQNTGNQAAQAATSNMAPPTGMGATQAVTDGQVVAMFNITSQFDIRRSYNPQTGEEFNVIVENSSDRPWYQREYFRVDWSKNLITDNYDFDTLAQIGIFGGIQYSPSSYEVTDPNDPNAPTFDMDTGYFDITTKAFATPQTVNTPFGDFPACYLPADYGGSNIFPVTNCGVTELTLRLSFKKVVDDDFEPADWDGNKMFAFGWFTEDRYGYDKNYGPVDQNWHRFAAKYNIWQQSHITGSQCDVDFWRDDKGAIQYYKTDGQGSFLTDGTTGLPIVAAPGDPTAQPFPGTPVGADPNRLASDGKTSQECAFQNSGQNIVHPGAYCDVVMKKCALPLNERQLKTIPWYYGPASAPDLFASTERALDDWNVAVKRGALIGQMVNAKRTGNDVTDPNNPFHGLISNTKGTLPLDANGYPSEQAIFADKAAGGTGIVPNVFVLCHNPVIDGDDPSCGPAGLTARVGDIRYNMVNIIPTPQTPSPWGIMVDANDPLTGEKVQTSVNEWGAVLDIASQGTEDLLRWINGEITDSQIADGSYMSAWVAASKLGTGSYQPKTLSSDEIKNRIASTNSGLAGLNGLQANDKRPPAIQRIAAQQNLAKVMGTTNLNSQFEAIRKGLIGSPFESQMIDSHWLQAAGYDPSTPFAGDPTATAMASPLRGMNPMMTKWITRQRDLVMAQHGFCSVDQPEPDALVGLARMAQKLFPVPDPKNANYPALKNTRDQALHQWIREQFHVSVIAHEMGHSMGLRHNFTGSWDSLNYKPQYWQLRTRNGAEQHCTQYTTPNADPDTCAGPRWIDPISDREVNGLIWKWASTTVMDYPGDQTQDMNEIGAYDKAAMRFCYGGIVDVQTDAPQNSTIGGDYLQQLDGFGGIQGSWAGGNHANLHYSAYNDTYHILNKCSAQTDPNDPLTATCDGFKLAYVDLRDMKDFPKYGQPVQDQYPNYDFTSHFAISNANDETKGMVRHPYMFGSDEFADIGNVPNYRFDSGADVYEQMEFVSSVYENRYIFDNFRRNRTTFSSLNVMDRVADRYWEKLKDTAKSFALVMGFQNNLNAALNDPGALMSFALGVPDAFATFIRAMTRPEPGGYVNNAPGTVLPLSAQPLPLGQTAQFGSLPPFDFNVPVGSGNGRFIENDYDYQQGYWWSSYQLKAGAWFEKRWAVQDLLEAYNYFIFNSEQDYVDGRYLNLNFASLYPHQVKRFMTNMLAGDPMTLGPYVTVPAAQLGNAQPSVMYLSWDKDQPLDYPTGATVLDPLVGWQDQLPTLIYQYIYSGATDQVPVAWQSSVPLYSDTTEELRVWSPGSDGQVDVPYSEQIRFRDPVSGIVYAARDYGCEQVNSKMNAAFACGGVQTTGGARMLQYAQQLADLAFNASGAKIPDTDNSGFTYPNYNVAAPKDPNSAAKLHGYVALLDAARQLSQWWRMSYPAFNNPN